MSCSGHPAHYYRRGDCLECGHPESDHAPDGYWGAEQDVTVPKRIEDQEREDDERLASVFGAAPR